MSMRPVRASNPLSRAIHHFDRATSRPQPRAKSPRSILVFGVTLAIAGFPGAWRPRSRPRAAVTTIMVFTIQHTQSRQEAAIQLKLDELIRAAPRRR